jgi:hypothetical protein
MFDYPEMQHIVDVVRDRSYFSVIHAVLPLSHYKNRLRPLTVVQKYHLSSSMTAGHIVMDELERVL